jgi:predicted RNA-binding Zn ribbon-like protein
VPETAVDLVVVEQFLNTLDERTFRSHGEKHVPSDGLTSIEALSAWLEAHGLMPAAQPADLAAAVTLRNALREAMTEGSAPALARFPLRLAPAPDGRLRIAADSGVPGLDPLVETVATSVADGSWNRLKLCSAEDCRWAFYDTSRNGGGRWCRMATCGNRNKTRAYRNRREQSDQTAPGT